MDDIKNLIQKKITELTSDEDSFPQKVKKAIPYIEKEFELEPDSIKLVLVTDNKIELSVADTSLAQEIHLRSGEITEIIKDVTGSDLTQKIIIKIR